jgi:hypothetical protein
MANEETTTQTEQTQTTSETTTPPGAGLEKVTDQTKTALGAGLDGAKATETKTEDKPVVPEKYADWKLPDGYELDAKVNEEASPLFKELGLTQDQAQKLVDFYSKHALATSREALDGWMKTRSDWREGIKNDPKLGKLVGSDGNFGPDSPLVVTVTRALDGLQNPKLVADFKEAMELTGAGDNPAFVGVLHALASKLTEGTSYAQGSPVASNSKRPSAGAALYPNLPAGG